MTAWRIRVTADRGDADAMSGLLWEAGTIGVEEQDTSRGTMLIAGFDDHAKALRAARELGGELEEVADDAGLDEWRSFATSIVAGSLHVVPSWINEATPRDLVRIAIDPARSFGSGSHESTRLVLEWLDDNRELVNRASILDFGCGSGVLAIAALALGAGRAMGVDVDPGAARAAAANAVANGVADRFNAVTADSPGHAATGSGRFDIILANLLLADLEPIAPGLVDQLAPEGVMVTAGLLKSQESRLAQALTPLTPIEVRHEGEWSMVAFGHQHS